jgi:peptide/nickel transport system substrate-binding protein
LGFPSVREIKARGRYTVVVTLKRRDALWQYTPAVFGMIFEKKFQVANGDTMGRPGVLTMGTGPFRFERLDPTRGVELSANPNWWRGRVPIQRVSVQFFSSEPSMALALRAGEIDVVPYIGGPAAFESTSGAKVVQVPTCGPVALAMNTKKPPWDDVHVRRAAAYAIDKRAIIVAAGVRSSPIPTFLTPLALGSLGSKAEVDTLLKSLPQYPFDLAKARAEMAQSKYRSGVPSTTIPVIAGFTSFENIAQALAGMWEKIGIKAEARPMPLGQWAALASGPRENVDTFLAQYTCNAADPGVFAFPNLHSKTARAGGTNLANYTNPAADAQIDAGLRNLDPTMRLAAYGKLLRILARDVPYIPLYTVNSSYALGSKFTFPRFHQFTVYTPGWLLGLKPR